MSKLEPLEMTDAEYHATQAQLRDQKEREDALRASYLAGVRAGLKRAAGVLNERIATERAYPSNECCRARFDALYLAAAALRAIDPASVEE